MADPVILYLSNNGLSIYRWQKKKLCQDMQFKTVEQASESLADYFKRYGKPARLVLDVLEETYSLESIPQLNRRDQVSLIRRKQQQLFPGLNYVYKAVKGRRASDRKDDLVLFAAITDESVLKPWLVLLASHKIIVSGVYSLPVLQEACVSQFQDKADKLLISVAKQGKGVYLRQSFFKDGVLALSRFKFINSTDSQEVAEEVKEDVERSLRFMARHFFVTTDKNLSAYFFATDALNRDFFDQVRFEDIRLSPVFIDTQAFAAIQGYAALPSDCSFSVFVAGLHARKPFLKTHYQDPQSQYFYRHYLIRKGLNIGSALMLTGALAYAGFGFFNGQEKIAQRIDLQRQRAQILYDLTQIPDVPSYRGLTPLQLQANLKTYQKTKQQALSGDDILLAISEALTAFPTVQLTRLSWGKAADEDTVKDNANDMMMPDMGADMGMDVAIDEGGLQTPPIEITVAGRIEPFNGDFRQALNQIERFRLRLAAIPSIRHVKAIQLPVTLDNDKELAGSVQNGKKEALFILTMEWPR